MSSEIPREEDFLLSGERIDDLQLDGLKLIQNPRLFSFGIDAVLLSSIIRCKKDGKILDIGSGNGIIPILISSKSEAETILGVEIQEELADLAVRSVKLNRLEGRVKIINGDIRELSEGLKGSFDAVSSNPPYFKQKAGIISDRTSKMISRHEICLSLKELFKAVYTVLKPRGKFFMIHRPERLVDIFEAARENSLEPKIARFVSSKPGSVPKLVLLEFIKGGGSELKWLKPLHVYEEDGSYGEEIKEIYSLMEIDSFSNGLKNKE